MSATSLWTENVSLPNFSELTGNFNVDVAIIGGGITGVTTAYLLRNTKLAVALLERTQCGSGDTHNTTAHLTSVTDLSLAELLKRFGAEGARNVWDAGKAALIEIEQAVREGEISCDLAFIPSYLLTSLTENDPRQLTKLRSVEHAAERLGIKTRWWDTDPFFAHPGLGFTNQARFHPLKYLSGLLKEIKKSEHCQIFEHSEVTRSTRDGKKIKLVTNKGTVTCHFLVIATHVPLMGISSMLGAGLFQSKLTPYTSYTLGAKVPKGSVVDALYWDLSDPYYYARLQPGSDFDYLIFGGEDHKTGQVTDTNDPYSRLETVLHNYAPQAEISSRWSGQIIETHDGLPFIGLSDENQFLATGYCGNGYTFGTIAAMMARDEILESVNPWREMFALKRKPGGSGAWEYLKENIDYPYYLIKDRLIGVKQNGRLDALAPGEGQIMEVNGKRAAVYRKDSGELITLSPVCTHLGCIIHWNSAERTWDCPCHGSRFHPTGEVLAGPAETPLKREQEPNEMPVPTASKQSQIRSEQHGSGKG